MHPQLDILSIDNTLECQALRASLEWWGIRVNMYWIGSANDIIQWNASLQSRYIFWGCHGTAEGICLPEIAPELETTQAFSRFLTPKDIQLHLQFPSESILLSNGCGTGTQALATAFLSAGVGSYLAPHSYIEGNASLLFSSCFYYFLLCKGLSVEGAYQKAKSLDEETEDFHLFVNSL